MLENIISLGIWQYEFLENTVKEWAIALIIFIGFLAVFKIVQNLILLRLKKLSQKTKTDIDDIFVEIVERLKPPFYSFLAFYFAFNFLTVDVVVRNILNAALLIWIVFEAIQSLQLLIDYMLRKFSGGEGKESAASGIRFIAKLALWSMGLLLILSNLGVNVTSLIAGLGIGGIAVALALQNILSDLFSSFAIYFDKPFEVGDFIIIGEHMGTVKKVGIKTTRIGSLQGEEIIISNKELTSSRVQNFKKMEKRRIVFSFGVTYETSNDKLKKIPDIIKRIIESVNQAEINRIHFKSFDNSALTFEVVYYVTIGDYNVYMDIQQEINFKIRDEFEKENISMAYPTRTVYMQKS